MLHNALGSLRFLNHGLAVILGLIGVKLVLHWAHSVWPQVPAVPTPLSLVVILLTLLAVTAWLRRRRPSLDGDVDDDGDWCDEEPDYRLRPAANRVPVRWSARVGAAQAVDVGYAVVVGVERLGFGDPPVCPVPRAQHDRGERRGGE